MTRQCKDLRFHSIGTCMSGSLLTVSLLFWEQAPSLVPVILMTNSSLAILWFIYFFDLYQWWVM